VLKLCRAAQSNQQGLQILLRRGDVIEPVLLFFGELKPIKAF
jgi:hypothetical protein